MTLWLSDHVTLGDKLKNQYPLFREVYDHQTWKVGDLLWEEPNCGVTWSSDIVVMCGGVTNCKFNISSLEKPMTMKLGKLVTYRELNAPMKPYTLWPPGHLRSRDKLKKFFFFLQKPYGHQTLQGADIRWHKAHNKVARLWSRDRKRSRVKLKTYTSSSIRPPPDLVGWWHMEPPMEPHDSFIMQLCEVTWKI